MKKSLTVLSGILIVVVDFNHVIFLVVPFLTYVRIDFSIFLFTSNLVTALEKDDALNLLEFFNLQHIIIFLFYQLFLLKSCD